MLHVAKVPPPPTDPHTPEVTHSFNLSHIEGKGLGYNTGYTSADLFYALPGVMSNFIPFVDLRGHLLDDGKWAANGGLGVRYCTSRVWGANLFYDFRQTHHHHYNQLGLGIETLGNTWDFRLNAYLPLGRTTSKAYDFQFAGFKGHQALISHKRERAYCGLDAELGMPLVDYKAASLYAGIGPYYFAYNEQRTYGGKARAQLKLWDYVQAEVSGSYDSLFKGIVQGMLSVNIPFGFGSCSRDCGCKVTPSGLQPVARQEIIVTRHHTTRKVAQNPRTNAPYTFWFVDNTSGVDSKKTLDGTFEHPFSTLKAAEKTSKPHNIVYVYEGDGTSKGMDTGIVLRDYQALWGASIDHPLATTQGLFSIPAQSMGMPLITNTLGKAVRLANHNEVSGLHIGNSTFGIFGDTITDVNINRNLMTINTLLPTTLDVFVVGETPQNVIQIVLQDAAGEIVIENNQLLEEANARVDIGVALQDFSGSNTPRHVTIAHNTIENQGIGVFVDNLRHTQLKILDNTLTQKPHAINDSFFTPIQQQLTVLNSGQGRLQAEVAHNTFVDGGRPMNFFLNDTSTTDFDIHDNLHTGKVRAFAFAFRMIYLEMNATNGQADVHIHHNNCNNMDVDGMDINVNGDIENPHPGIAKLNLMIDHNNLDLRPGNSAVAISDTKFVFLGIPLPTVLTATISDNQSNADGGYFAVCNSLLDWHVIFENNVDTNTAKGANISVSQGGSGNYTAIILNNDMHGPSNIGTRVEDGATGTLSLCLSNNTFPLYKVSNFSTTGHLLLQQQDNHGPVELTGNIQQTTGLCPQNPQE